MSARLDDTLAFYILDLSWSSAPTALAPLRQPAPWFRL